MSDTTVLACRNISKIFKDSVRHIPILDELDFTLEAGERVAILGPSGSGKSTLLHILGGLDNPTSGEVLINGEAVHTLKERERCRLRNSKLGFVYQFHHLLPEFSAIENVAMPLRIGGVTLSEAKQKAQHILSEVGLAERLTHRLSQLSGGERQRVAIARALVSEPAIVLADEPTGNLDPQTAEQVYDSMLALNTKQQTSLVIVTHDITLAKRMDRILTLKEGKLVSDN